jgi:hypothetical protein
MIIPKLLKNEIQLYHCYNEIIIFIEIKENWIISELIYVDGNKCKYSFDEDCSINDSPMNINTANEKVISINPKYKKLLLSNDKIIVDMTIDCILEDAKDFINEYLNKFK